MTRTNREVYTIFLTPYHIVDGTHDLQTFRHPNAVQGRAKRHTSDCAQGCREQGQGGGVGHAAVPPPGAAGWAVAGRAARDPASSRARAPPPPPRRRLPAARYSWALAQLRTRRLDAFFRFLAKKYWMTRIFAALTSKLKETAGFSISSSKI